MMKPKELKRGRNEKELKRGRNEKLFESFRNPLAVIQATLDLLSRDPGNIEKIELACGIINREASKISLSMTGRLKEELLKDVG